MAEMEWLSNAVAADEAAFNALTPEERAAKTEADAEACREPLVTGGYLLTLTARAVLRCGLPWSDWQARGWEEANGGTVAVKFIG